VNKTDRIKPQIDVAVRKLAESIRRDGGLASVMQGGISGVEGTRIHQHFLKTADYRFPGCELYPEESLSCRFTANDLPFDLNVQGRCDLAVISPEGELTVVEIKGFRGSLRSLPLRWRYCPLDTSISVRAYVTPYRFREYPRNRHIRCHG